MDHPASDPVPPRPAPGLPPVTPPSGRFIAQLFLVPGLIVMLAVLLLLLFRSLVGGGYTAEHFLRQLDNSNTDIRWRGASDLAQVLEKPDNLPLRCDAVFALDLTQRLRVAWDDLVQEEKAHAERLQKMPPEDREPSWRKLTPQRDYVRFLIAAVARSHAPVAMPVLADIAQRDQSPDVKGLTLVRRQALWGLGILGQNIQTFTLLPVENQAQILRALDEEIAAQHAVRSSWARNALKHLDAGKVPPDAAGLVEMDKVLAQCAAADDPYIREQVALALLFWDGPRVEPTLLKLARDDGRGHLVRVLEAD